MSDIAAMILIGVPAVVIAVTLFLIVRLIMAHVKMAGLVQKNRLRLDALQEFWGATPKMPVDTNSEGESESRVDKDDSAR
jgi:hypothetical protein